MNPALTRTVTPELFARIYDLLALQVKHYHHAYRMGDNTSVPEETAKALMASILYTLEKAPSAIGSEAFAQGQVILEAQAEEAKKLLHLVQATAPDFASESYYDTLKALERWLNQYDWQHFAHRAPAYVDYPLLYQGWEDLQGIDRVLCILKCLWQENQILAAPADFEGVYQRFGPEFWNGPVNLCEQPLITAVERCLAGRSPAANREDALSEALDEVCRTWDLQSPEARSYARLVLPTITARWNAGLPPEEIF